MARTVDPHSWPFAVPPRHPATIPFWIAMVIQAANLVSHLSGGNGVPTWASAVAVALLLTSAVAARTANARARRQLQDEPEPRT